MQMLQREQWSPIEPNKALPQDAEIDWLRGKVRAPSSWELQLNSSRFCLLDATRGAAMALDAADEFTLENVQPNMTIRTASFHAVHRTVPVYTLVWRIDSTALCTPIH